MPAYPRNYVTADLKCAYPQCSRKSTLVELTCHPRDSCSFIFSAIIHDSREKEVYYTRLARTIERSGFVRGKISILSAEPQQPYLFWVIGTGAATYGRAGQNVASRESFSDTILFNSTT
jgi:hypothetical protein